MTEIVNKFFWFPETIQGKTYWMKRVWVEQKRYIIHCREDGCSSDIWTTEYLRVVSKLERMLK